jgi:hypothetical protein
MSVGDENWESTRTMETLAKDPLVREVSLITDNRKEGDMTGQLLLMMELALVGLVSRQHQRPSEVQNRPGDCEGPSCGRSVYLFGSQLTLAEDLHVSLLCAVLCSVCTSYNKPCRTVVLTR